MPKRFAIHRTAVIDAPIEAVYDVVADVERYPEFLPDVRAVRVRGPLIEMTVNLGPLILTWTQRATFNRPHSIGFVQVEGSFRSLGGGWTFEAVDGRTRVTYATEFELGTKLPGIDRLVERALAETVDKTIAAFHRRLKR